jgi:hypothetical protein
MRRKGTFKPVPRKNVANAPRKFLEYCLFQAKKDVADAEAKGKQKVRWISCCLKKAYHPFCVDSWSGTTRFHLKLHRRFNPAGRYENGGSKGVIIENKGCHPSLALQCAAMLRQSEGIKGLPGINGTRPTEWLSL